jgi:DNA-directed RNA polymerase specialized sigma24 family protein
MASVEGCSLALSSIESGRSEIDLAALVETYSSLLFRVAHSVLRSREEAEDVVQDVFVRVLEHRRSLTAVRDMRVWLVRVAWNLAAPGWRGGDGTDCSIGVTGDPIGPGPSASPAALPTIEHAYLSVALDRDLYIW